MSDGDLLRKRDPTGSELVTVFRNISVMVHTEKGVIAAVQPFFLNFRAEFKFALCAVTSNCPVVSVC